MLFKYFGSRKYKQLNEVEIIQGTFRNTRGYLYQHVSSQSQIIEVGDFLVNLPSADHFLVLA
jgi:hypothetical protein